MLEVKLRATDVPVTRLHSVREAQKPKIVLRSVLLELVVLDGVGRHVQASVETFSFRCNRKLAEFEK